MTSLTRVQGAKKCKILQILLHIKMLHQFTLNMTFAREHFESDDDDLRNVAKLDDSKNKFLVVVFPLKTTTIVVPCVQIIIT